METPVWAPPKDDRERRILDRLVETRDSLLLLKSDRTTYIRSQDVLPLYNEIIQQVKELNEMRSEDETKKEETQRMVFSVGPLTGHARD
jgi:hypothetical protein